MPPKPERSVEQTQEDDHERRPTEETGQDVDAKEPLRLLDLSPEQFEHTASASAEIEEGAHRGAGQGGFDCRFNGFIGRMETTTGPWNGPAGVVAMVVRYIGTVRDSAMWRISMPSAIRASSKENEQPMTKLTRSSRQ